MQLFLPSQKIMIPKLNIKKEEKFFSLIVWTSLLWTKLVAYAKNRGAGREYHVYCIGCNHRPFTTSFHFAFHFCIRIIAWSLCPLFFTIFKRQMYFFLSSNEVHWKKIYLTFVFFPHCFKNIYSLLGYQALPASLKLLV